MTHDLLTKRRGAVTIEDQTPAIARIPIELPNSSFEDQLRQVLHRSEVASTDWFLRLVDQSVGAQVVKGPYCGPYQTPLPNYSVIALSNADTAGQATAIGMAPFATCLDAEAGVRLSIGRMLTRLMLAGIDDIARVKVLCNWMWPANIKPPDGEVALLYKATQAVRDTLIALATAIIGGKDSPSMATWVNGILVKSIETVIFSASVLTDSIFDHLTGDIKNPDESLLVHIDFAKGKRRLGGSSLGLSNGQLGDFAPDLDDPEMIKLAIPKLHELIVDKIVTAGLEIGQGGLAVTVAKMCIAGGCGATVLTHSDHPAEAEYFAEELGLVVECPRDKLEELKKEFEGASMPFSVLGHTTSLARVVMRHNSVTLVDADTWQLRRDWEETSHQLWNLVVNSDEATDEWSNTRIRRKPVCVVTSSPVVIPKLRTRQKPRAVVLRARGSNGQQEFSEALARVGFRVDDVHFSDLLGKRVTLDPYQFLAIPGGWGDMDVFGAAMGMYLRATRNPHVKDELERYMARDNTLVMGICNGAQFALRMGYAPLPTLSLSRTRPLFTDIKLGHFNHQSVTLLVDECPSIFTQGLTGSIMPGVVANGEGRFNCSDAVMQAVLKMNLVALSYVDHNGERTTELPYCPSGSFVAGVTDPTGRRLALMPHVFDRLSLVSRMPYVPEEIRAAAQDSDFSPWMHFGLNAFKWCRENH
jgi:phosphoribosylformylglycinamidine synthase